MPKYIVRIPETIEHIIQIDCVDEQSAKILAYQQIMNTTGYDENYDTESLGTDARNITVQLVKEN